MSDLIEQAKAAMKARGCVCPACGHVHVGPQLSTKNKVRPVAENDMRFGCCGNCGHIFIGNPEAGVSRNVTRAERAIFLYRSSAPEFRKFRERVTKNLIG